MIDHNGLRTFVRQSVINEKLRCASHQHIVVEVRFYPDSQHVEIAWIKTEPQRATIGQTVVDELKQYCQENNQSLVASYVIETAVGFWEKLGFTRCGEHMIWTPARII